MKQLSWLVKQTAEWLAYALLAPRMLIDFTRSQTFGFEFAGNEDEECDE